MPGLDAPFTRPLRQLSAVHALFDAAGRTPSRDPAEMLAWYHEHQREEWQWEQLNAAGSTSPG